MARMIQSVALLLLLCAAQFSLPPHCSGQIAFDPNLPSSVFEPSEPDFSPGFDERNFRDDTMGGAVDPSMLFEFRAQGVAILDTIYDTGLVNSEPRFLPSTIVLDGTPQARGRGKFQMAGTSSRVKLDFYSSGPVSATTDFDFIGGLDATDFAGANVRLRNAAGVVEVTPDIQLIGGQFWTTFGDERGVPFSVVTDGTPAGAIFRRQPQLRLTKKGSTGVAYSVAMEDPTSGDFFLPTPSGPMDPARNVRLQRWPDVVARMQWVRPDDEHMLDRWQVATLIRSLGYEDVMNDEHSVVGWGVSCNARFRVRSNNNVQIGGVYGEGLGRYLFGFGSGADQTAAGPDPLNGLQAVEHVGGFIGYQHFWTPVLASNVAYGYAFADTTAAMLGVPRTTQNAWVNFVYEVSETFHVALEYQYGALRVTEGTEGDDHRLQMTVTYRAKAN